MKSVSILYAACFCVAVTCQAQTLDMSNEAFGRAAVTLTLVDQAYQTCEKQKGLSQSDLSKHSAWQRANGVDEIRTRLNELMADANIKQSIETVKASASDKFRGRITACNFYRSAVSSPESQFASATPEVLASLKKADTGPNVALLDKPKWRRSGGKLQRTSSEGWRDLAFQVSYPKLPDDFRLNGTFGSTSGVGTAGESVVAWRGYQFSANGQVEREAGVGSDSKVADGTTVSKTVSPHRKGTYRIEGLTLRIAYDDGSNESYVLVADPKDPRAIWLDGVGYRQTKK
jgi:hypothetical protein